QLLRVFFRADDGIRGFHVTGVQTCALPIFPINFAEIIPPTSSVSPSINFPVILIGDIRQYHWGEYFGLNHQETYNCVLSTGVSRSEERRVGKGCGARRAGGRCEGARVECAV